MRSFAGGRAASKRRSCPAAPLTTQCSCAPPRISLTQVLQARQRRAGSPRCKLRDPVRIGDQRAAERDEIGLAACDRVGRALRIAEPADRDHRNADALLHRRRRSRETSRRDRPSAGSCARPTAASGSARRRCAARPRPPPPPRPRSACPRRRRCPAGNSRRPTRDRSPASMPTAALTARSTSRPKRARFSSEPPYSSVRRFSNGVTNCEIR